MLTEERYATILRILKEKQAVTVPELTRALCTSESTIRRDLTALHKRGMLYKVYGGATSIDSNYTAMEEDMPTKSSRCTEEKIAIARRAASLVTRKDFVYIDAGSTTLHMVDFLQERQAVYVTNGLPHASRLSLKGFKVFLLGGRLKAITEAVIGTEALHNLELYNFTKGFFKSEALSRCEHAYVLADQSKFNKISPITFANISSATIITGHLRDKNYRDCTTILEGE